MIIAANPTLAWRARMVDGDAVFTEERVAGVEAALGHYASAVQSGAEPMVAMPELRAYLEDVARSAGRFPATPLPTEDWREW